MALVIPITGKRRASASEPSPNGEATQEPTRRRAGLEDLGALLAYVATQQPPVPDLNLLVAQPVGFDGDDWDLAAWSLGIEARIDVVAETVDTIPEHLVRVAAIMRPDAILLDWRSPQAPILFDTLRNDPDTERIPIVIISDDGEQAAPRMLCGVWEDPAPEEFDDVVHLLDAINSRTMVTRLAPQADSSELQAWFNWVSQSIPSVANSNSKV